MISSMNNNSPNFGECYLHASIRHLGAQGEKSYEIVAPILDKLTKDNLVIIGAVPNQEKGGKHTLTIFAQGNDAHKQKGLLGKFKEDVYTTVLQQSCTDATSPEHLLQNIVSAQEGINNAIKKSSDHLVNMVNDFFEKPGVAEKTEEYDKMFKRVPTENEIDTDIEHGDEIAKQNGCTFDNPFGEE